MRSKKMVLLFMIVSLFTLTGCWNSRELDELAFTYGFGIDKVDGEYSVTAQVINPEQVSNKKTSGTGSPVVMYEGRDKTVLSAIRKISLVSPRKIYGGHLYTLIVSEEVAREGLSDILDLFNRDPESRSDFYVVVAKDHTAKDILSMITPFLVAPTLEIFEQLELSSKNWDPSKTTTLRELISKIPLNGIHPVVPSILPGKPTGGQSESNMKTPQPPLPSGQLAVFYHDQLRDWLEDDEARTYNIISNNVKNSVTPFPCSNGGYGVMESQNVKTKLKPDFSKNKPTMNIDITFKGKIAELDCSQDITTTDEFFKMEKQIEKYLQRFFTTNTKSIQQNVGIDILGFGQEFYRKRPNEWRKMEDNWDEIFEELPVNIHVTVNLKNAGTIKNSLKEKLRELSE
ncbi:Ger(x)C family spore germination protein [Bacillus norwichensis]|uniref:Ger(X)C family spore germination protein n=1 Tax=Bacillus norwichensis TaxID=2762217 RepID=A0ABR8VJ26_9BACI|nr:Ger(x)C family spore germination protein [Bacillus norwichensis]MBD8004786.1 Ger(x)C family spore germination protein [Bacillus norwichensis]